MQLSCRRICNEKNIQLETCGFPSCGPFDRVAYRFADAVSSRLPDCVLFSPRPSSRYRSPSLIVGIAPPVSTRLVVSPRLSYRWTGSCVGLDGGRGEGVIDGVRRNSRLELSTIVGRLSIVPLSRQMRERHTSHTVPASM